ncbi:transglutaminase-like cysteine peptidase [Limibacillus sp. MBR-115]|jgi:predicted transglutaminase-like cysteine proteinase|uniref:transglutaminase-like cysteine peptidase n=1 Tax=Limibacillus sp. MBR-115 TaxID=3156465 RepID=UPI00339430FF
MNSDPIFHPFTKQFLRIPSFCLAVIFLLAMTVETMAASNSIAGAASFRHAALGNLVSLSTDLVPKWSRVRTDLKSVGRGRVALARSQHTRSWSRWGHLVERKKAVTLGALAVGIHRRLQKVAYREDGDGDVWQTPEETLAAMAGDCEDQAILGLSLALAAGVPPSEVGLAVGYDKYGRAHAILAIFDGDRVLAVDINEPKVQEIEASGFQARMVTFVDQVWITRN